MVMRPANCAVADNQLLGQKLPAEWGDAIGAGNPLLVTPYSFKRRRGFERRYVKQRVGCKLIFLFIQLIKIKVFELNK